jgi:hypothetical protein
MASILLWFIIGSKGKWETKAFVTFAYLYFGLLIWIALESYLGWPSKQDFPNKYVIHWAHVEEPDASNEGAIYLWLSEIDSNKNYNFLEYQSKKDEPRIYQIPYSKDLHKKIQNMMENIKKGSVYVGGKKTNKMGFELNADPMNNGQFEFDQNSKENFIFNLPPATLPEKK